MTFNEVILISSSLLFVIFLYLIALIKFKEESGAFTIIRKAYKKTF